MGMLLVADYGGLGRVQAPWVLCGILYRRVLVVLGFLGMVLNPQWHIFPAILIFVLPRALSDRFFTAQLLGNIWWLKVEERGFQGVSSSEIQFGCA